MTDEPHDAEKHAPATTPEHSIALGPFGAVRGVPVVLGDGRTWTIPRAIRSAEYAEERDRIADAYWTGGKVRVHDYQGVALALLSAAYDVPTEQLAELITTADQGQLLEAVRLAIVGPYPNELIRRNHTEWVATGLAANGLIAAKIPDEMLPGVVKQLVDTGRMCRPEAFISSAIGYKTRADVLGSLTED